MMLKDLTYRMSETSKRAYSKRGEELRSTERYSSAISEWPSFMREAFGKLYRPSDCNNELPMKSDWASEVMQVMQSSSDWDELSRASRMNRLISEESTRELCEFIAQTIGLDSLPKDGSAARSEQDFARQINRYSEMAIEYDIESKALQEIGETEEAKKVADSKKACDKILRSLLKSAGRSKARRRIVAEKASTIQAQVSSAVKQVARKASAMAEACSLMAEAGMSSGVMGNDGEIDKTILDLIMQSKEIREIMRILGREVRENTKKNGFTVGGNLEVMGIESGKDIMSMTQGEMRSFALGGIMRMDVLSRAESGCILVKERRGEDEAGRGEFIALVDRSGSMYGENQRFARASAMAMIISAMKEKRRVVVIAFDSGPFVKSVIEKDGSGLNDAIKTLLLPASGGTDAVSAMRGAIKELDPRQKGRVDTIIITDGHWEDPTSKEIEELRREGGTFRAILMDGAPRKDWLDQSWRVNDGKLVEC